VTEKESIVGTLTEVVGKDNLALVIVAVVLVILGFIATCVCVRYLMYKSKKDVIEMQKRVQKKIDFDEAESNKIGAYPGNDPTHMVPKSTVTKAGTSSPAGRESHIQMNQTDAMV